MNSKKRTILDIVSVCFDINANAKNTDKAECYLSFHLNNEQYARVSLWQKGFEMREYVYLGQERAQDKLNLIYDALVEAKTGKKMDVLLDLDKLFG